MTIGRRVPLNTFGDIQLCLGRGQGEEEERGMGRRGGGGGGRGGEGRDPSLDCL
jgi:hypothetical protein